MMRNWRAIAVIPVAIVMVGGFLGYEFLSKPEPATDFTTMTDVKKKKLAFFNFMLPLVRQANDKVRQERRTLVQIHEQLVGGKQIKSTDTDRVHTLNEKYQAKLAVPYEAEDLQLLLKRVDTIPESLALAQSANESAWGTSRFATEANNFFGLWCFTRGCGLTPKQRDEGLVHEVARFDSVSGFVISS